MSWSSLLSWSEWAMSFVIFVHFVVYLHFAVYYLFTGDYDSCVLSLFFMARTMGVWCVIIQFIFGRSMEFSDMWTWFFPRPPPGPDSNPRGPNNDGNGSGGVSGTPLMGTTIQALTLIGAMDVSATTIIMPIFVSSRGNEYFCEIDEDYLTDRFNLTGLNTEVSYYQYALDLVTDVFDLDADDDLREQIEKSARHLYGLVHARYIVTTRGLAKMLEKYKKSDFGKCPRVMCDGHALLPVGQADLPNMSTVKLYCPKCEDIYNPKSSRHASIDGAYFGTSFHSILFQVYPALNPEKSSRRYEPRIYGFKVHAAAALARYQDMEREDLKSRLAEVDIQHRFIEDSESDGDAFEYDEDYAEGRTEPAKNQGQAGDAASAPMEIGN
ncbi:hypothetical protein N7452_009704 [Penicillium brevicompactum]|uniref:Casein kinase II subunit beta n=1 Tax=Penicillium brevicompactum TaxID=5074 RepID=A0A9W9UBG4_PENBR|nr:hypothetical protein N7452_009704 [Penicillium brevicompactum]